MSINIFKKTLIFLFVICAGTALTQSALAVSVGALNNIAQTSAYEFVANPNVIQVVLSGPSGDTITLDYAVNGGNATGGGVDYTLANGTLTFNPGETSKFVPISVVSDELDENDETVQFAFSNPVNANLVGPVVNTFTIIDDDPLVLYFVVNNASNWEWKSNPQPEVRLSHPHDQQVTVNYSRTGGTASGSGVDFSGANGTLTFNPGDVSKTIPLTIVGDSLDESDETITLTLAVPVGAPIDAARGNYTYTILDDDPQELFHKTTVESAFENLTPVLQVILSQPSGQTVTVDYAVTGGTATGGGVDYTLAGGTLTFTPNETVKNIAPFTIVNDGTIEPDETIEITLSNPTGGVPIAPGKNVLTFSIKNEDGPPRVYFRNAASDADEGVSSFSIPVDLSWPFNENVTVNYAVTGGTATGGGVDYTLASGTRTFNPGNTVQNINVSVVNDMLEEDIETVVITLSNPSPNAQLGATTVHTFSIKDNDAPTRMLFHSGADHGHEGVGLINLFVDRTGPTNLTSTVDYAVTGGTATGGGVDYTFTSGTLTFNPGETAKGIPLTFVDDSLNEDAETIILALSNPTGGILGAITVHTDTIDNNDPVPTVSFPNPSSSGFENQTPSLHNIVLSAASGKTITVDYATANGSAVAGSDYTAISGTKTFNPGETTKQISVPIINDLTVEQNEAFTINLSNPVNANPGPNMTHQKVIKNDDPVVIIIETSGSTSAAEGGLTDTFTIELGSIPSNNVVVTAHYNPTQLSTDVFEYEFTPENYNVPQTATVTAVDDAIAEGPHGSPITFTSNSQDLGYNNLFIGKAVNVTLTDNDAAGIVVNAGSVDVTEGGTKDVIQINLTTEPLSDVWIFVTGDAQVTAQPEKLTFTSANWSTPQMINVTAIDNKVAEGNHKGYIILAAKSQGDEHYNNYPLNKITANVTDNDRAAVVITEKDGSTSVSKDVTDIVTVSLSTMPSDAVTIDMSSTHVSTNPSTLTFTKNDWDLGQDVVVAVGANDDGSVSADTITFKSNRSLAPEYKSLTINPVTVTITASNVDNGFDLMRVMAKDAQVPENTESELKAHILNEIAGLTFQWAQLSGPAVSIINATSHTALFTAPAFDVSDRTITFALTVSDGTNTMTTTGDDVATITVMPQNVQLDNPGSGSGSGAGHTNHMQGRVRAILPDGTPVVETQSFYGGMDRHTIKIGDSAFVYTDSDGPIRVLALPGSYLAISDAQSDNKRGLVAIFNASSSLRGKFDLRDSKTLANTYWTIGNQEGDLFGFDISPFDDGSGVIKLSVSAPGMSTGAVFIIDFINGQGITNVIFGSSSDRITSLMVMADLNGDGIDDPLVGTTDAARFATDASVSEDDQTSASRSASVFAGFTEPQPVIDLSSDSPTILFETTAAMDLGGRGDVNGDDIDDSIFASRDECIIEVHYGSSTLEDIEVAGDTISCEGGLRSMAVGDVTGDGIDDIVLGIVNDANGALYILVGGETLSDFITISGGTDEGLGEDIFLFDHDGDGRLDVVSRSANSDDETSIINVAGLVNGEDGTWSDDGASTQALGGGGFSCVLNTAATPPAMLWWLVFILIPVGRLAFRFRAR